MTASYTNGTTFTDGSAIEIVQPGYYGVDWGVSVHTGNNNQVLEAGVMVDSTMIQSTMNMQDAVNLNKAVSISGCGIIYASASQKMRLAVENASAANDIVLEHATFKVVRLS